MSHIEDIVDSLENKISKVLHEIKLLKQTNLKLNEELERTKEKLQFKQLELSTWEDKYDTLKMANSMLGSDDNKRETKLKINALIRDIDYCIAQLSD